VTIPAAGTVPWRHEDGGLEVAVVHRPKYDDWSWAKGKLDDGEQWPVAAVRETLEETGLQVRLGFPLPTTEYRVLGPDGRPATKQVRYWAARATGGTALLLNEIDQVAWLDPGAAHDRLDYPHDRDQLRAVLQADQAGVLPSWPLVIVRHALAEPRSAWKRADGRRPLVESGLGRSEVIAGLLGAYGVTDIVTSPSKRCVQTVGPYAVSAGITMVTRGLLSEEGFGRRGPAGARKILDQAVERGNPAAVCTHGPLLPGMLKAVRARVSKRAEGGRAAYRLMNEAIAGNLDKGEALVAHLAGTGERARVVAVERHRL
jgi:8-oxo-dGTP pyrophosphatase MutT (NUDIX family)